MKQPSNCWKQSIEAGQFLANLKALGGATVRGENGNLHIALTPEAMCLPPDATAPLAWLLPLTDLEMVRHSANVSGRVLWISPCPPRKVAGALVGDFQGAWWNGTEACLQLGNEIESYVLPPGSTAIGLPKTLALIVALRWSGFSQRQTESVLRANSESVITPVVAPSFSTSQLAVA